MSELEQALETLNAWSWGGGQATGYEYFRCEDTRKARALINQAIEQVKQLTAERDRYKAALEYLAAWNDGEIGRHTGEPVAVANARHALGRTTE